MTPQCLHQFLLKMDLPASDESVFDDFNSCGPSDSTGSEYGPEENLKSILFFQEQLNDLIRDLT